MEKNETYIKKWLSGTLDEAEKKKFEKTEDYKSIRKLSESLLSFKAPEFNVDAEYERLRARISTKEKIIKVNWVNPLLKVAAVLFIMAGVYFFFFHSPQTVVKTMAAEKQEVMLPDSTLVVVNAISQLSFNETKWQKQRKVELEGEAFFKVTKGSTFDVETSTGTISVLGTQFNVRSRKDYFEVTCYEGSVKVKSATADVTLKPRHIFRIINEKVSTGLAENSQQGWIFNESSFKSIPFYLVVQEFERQYNVSVTVKNADTNQLFTGAFTHTDLSMALKSITIPLHLTAKTDGDKQIVLEGDKQ